jgi:chromosome partitioning protein
MTTSAPMTIAVVAQKGGAGKTTLAINLAAAAERTGKVALIIDTDPQASACEWA